MNWQAPQTLNGIRVFVTPDIPKMKLGPGDYVTPAFRAEMDEWLLQFFGTTNLVEDGKCYHMLLEDAVSMNPRTYAKLRAALWEPDPIKCLKQGRAAQEPKP